MSYTFAVVVEDKSPELAFAAAKSNPLSAPLLESRVNFKFLDNWVIFPYDKLAMSRANGVLCGPPSHFSKQISDRMTFEALSDTCWALKIQPITKGNSRVVFFEGNYQDYEANKKERLGEEAARPHRLRFRPLTLP